jgi:hypothetical protein
MSETFGIDRGRFCGATAATFAAGPLGLLGSAERSAAMTQVAQDKGGHFAAWEQPQLFSQELRAALRPLRK